MNKKFTILTAALALLTILAIPIGMWGQTRTTDTIWSENFSSYSADDVPSGGTYSYSCTDGGGTTKIYDEEVAGGTKPELLIGKSNGKFSAVIPLDGYEGTLTLTYYQNKQKLSVSSTTTGVSGGQDIKPSSVGQQTTTFTGITTSMTSITIVFEATTSSNVRLDNIVLTGEKAAPTPSHTITPVSNNDTYGTVDLSGTTITATPNSGYRVKAGAEGYTLLNGTATVTNNGDNTFSVTPESDCTVQINFEAIPTHTATFSVNGATTSNTFAEGATITFPSNPSDIQGKVFRGWVITAIDGTIDEEPSYVNTTTTTMGASDVTYYAVFATATPSGEPEETLTQTLQYDSWSYSGSTTDKGTYRLFHTDSYIESSAFDLSKLSKVKVFGGTFGGTSYNSLTIGDGTNTWKNVTVSGNSETGENTYQGGNALSGTKALRVTSNSGTATGSGVRISKVEIYTNEIPYTYSAFCTTIVVPVLAPSFSPAAGTYYSGQTVTLSCETAGATIRYTTDGSDPTSSSNVYSSAFTLAHTTTIKAKAFKDEDASSIAEATYTIQYSVKFYVNGSEDTSSAMDVVEGETIGTLPTAIAPNGYTFMGWAISTISGVQDSAPTMVTSETTVEADLNLQAVFALGVETIELQNKQYIMNDTYFNSSSYSSNDGDKDINGVNLHIKDVYKNDGIQFKASTGSLYNNNALGLKIVSIVINVSNNTFNVYEGGTKNPSSSVSGSGSGSTKTYTFSTSNNMQYFKITSTSSYAKASQISVNYIEAVPVTTYYYCTTVNTLSGDLSSVSTSVGNAYYISAAANVPANTAVTINGVLGNADASLLTINNGGQLICNNEVQATVKKTISAWTTGEPVGGWYLIASPADTVNIASTLATGTYDLYGYNEPTHHWLNYKKAENSSFFDELKLRRGKGYLYANEAEKVISFAGSMKETDVNVKMPLSWASSDETLKGYNLIGNPFTCTAYLTDGRDFLRMNTAGNGLILNTAAGGGGNAINVCEGVFVEATSATDTVTFTTTEPVSSVGPDNSMITLNLTQNRGALVDNARIRFGEGNNMTKFVLNENASMLYIPQNGKDYAVVRSEAQGEMPVNFKADKNGSYTLSIDIDADMDYLHLIDNMTGADVDLLANPSYTFDARTSDYASRFRLVFSANTVDDNTSTGSATFAYFNGSEWVVNSNGNATLQVVDVMGRVLSSETVNGNHNMNLNLSTGVYMLRLVNGNDVKTQKIVVR